MSLIMAACWSSFRDAGVGMAPRLGVCDPSFIIRFYTISMFPIFYPGGARGSKQGSFNVYLQ